MEPFDCVAWRFGDGNVAGGLLKLKRQFFDGQLQSSRGCGRRRIE
jgi:hypothetical protein